MLKNNINVILANSNICKSLNKYVNIMKRGNNWENDFCSLYQFSAHSLHLNQNDFLVFKKQFFIILQKPYSNSSDLKDVLQDLSAAYKASSTKGDRCLLSFATKLLHTNNANLPIYDRIVGYEHFRVTPAMGKNINARINNACKKYDDYCKEFTDYLNKVPEAKMIIAEFRNNYSFNISDVKIIDTVLWLDR